MHLSSLSPQQHSYRATLIPAGLEAEDVETHAARGMLTPLRLKASNGEEAASKARQVSGLRVHDVERVEPTEETVAH